ncbi:hypothetical protein O5274_27525, partial [Escherichia coli]|nr:hypothetical protein [Escherichia coli]
ENMPYARDLFSRLGGHCRSRSVGWAGNGRKMVTEQHFLVRRQLKPSFSGWLAIILVRNYW